MSDTNDAWASGLGVTALVLGLPLALTSAVAGLRLCRYLVSVCGFLTAGLLLYSLLGANIDRINLTQHDIIFISIGAGVLGAVGALVFWRRSLVLWPIHLGILIAVQILATPLVMDTDPDIFDAVKIYPAISAGILLHVVFYIYYPQSLILLSSAALGSWSLTVALDVALETGFSKRLFRVVSEATHCKTLFGIAIYLDDFPGPNGNDEEEYFLIVGWLLVMMLMLFIQAYGTAATFQLDWQPDGGAGQLMPADMDDGAPLLAPVTSAGAGRRRRNNNVGTSINLDSSSEEEGKHAPSYGATHRSTILL